MWRLADTRVLVRGFDDSLRDGVTGISWNHRSQQRFQAFHSKLFLVLVHRFVDAIGGEYHNVAGNQTDRLLIEFRLGEQSERHPGDSNLSDLAIANKKRQRATRIGHVEFAKS